ncbi:endonuclease III [Acetobacteroides hydrogenigenes]|uniref:Endonuclease III n=1 Tax=Acetobacteroides hydrogenigenes TaxID=979970 RepID=A0A4R2EMQ8_9BACT|nr:endonuclease III [Acetobacteroides hydrogenigenes]TCN68522.1 endonuclease-3 [Acetobacteroides hydrogenigenes]
MTKKQKYEFIVKYFSEKMPDPKTELKYTTPYELLVAVVLSAQCTDKRVNMVTPNFFKRFPTVDTLAEGSIEEIFDLIRSISYPNNKSKHLHGMAQMLLKSFNGEIPSDVDELQMLPGVGRKTANVIASVIFNKPAMAVDTHVFRVSKRLGLTPNAKNPLDTERELVKHFKEEQIPNAHHWLILHGRYTCFARKPNCKECGLTPVCSYYLDSSSM